jgi:hypothetical protein
MANTSTELAFENITEYERILACSRTQIGQVQTAPGEALQKKYGKIKPVAPMPRTPMTLRNRNITWVKSL